MFFHPITMRNNDLESLFLREILVSLTTHPLKRIEEIERV